MKRNKITACVLAAVLAALSLVGCSSDEMCIRDRALAICRGDMSSPQSSWQPCWLW